MYRDHDSEIFKFIEKFSEDVGDLPEFELRMRSVFGKGGESHHSCYVNGLPQDTQGSDEIFKKLRATNNLSVHNSTSTQRPFFFSDENFVEILEAHFSADDRRSIATAQKNLETRIRKATKQHKAELDNLLGKFKDKIQVELTALGGDRSSKVPLQIKLTDKVSEVSLQEWGAGTQNRTRVFMSILDAQHSKEAASAGSKSNPVFLVEEPESFLHPSGQAEFGQILNALADEFDIQIIATTHSPYMLNQRDPSANYLLERRMFRGSARDTVLVEAKGDDWMIPFADNLGLVSSEFHDWKKAFSSHSSKVVLVEGDIDREYFELFREKFPNIYKIAEDVEVVPYEGKDALKNTALLRFMINKFKKVFITFDLDASKDVTPSLGRLGLQDGQDFSSIGVNRAGCECIEGLLPDSIRSAVHSINVDDVNAMMSADNNIRRGARQRLKRAYLERLRLQPPSETELTAFKVLFGKIASAFNKV